MEDLSHWPLVVGVYREEATLQAYQAQLDSWQAWFAREQPFALLRVYATHGSLAHPEGSAAAGKSWLAQNRPLLQRWVIGMATVILPPQDYARLKNMQVEKAFGVPGGVFASVEEAIAWLQGEVSGIRDLQVSITTAQIMT
ncbi:hypothetical protein [Ottowia testudinis]|uniref:SpoIIAA-like protein n=1 Tax=Ottowia testudinis TaxID=2816950 RepID=A0A975CD12_9BURK|nr:hypothetical protein [Ottowia testudinis]QTD43617.1 hypothetical protein J1M35_10565 [Ottowia testudinis]